MEFDDYLAPLTRQTFFRDYWEQTFVHLRGQAGRFAGLLSWDDLNTLVGHHRLAPPHIRLSQDGRTIEPDRYLHTPPGAGNVARVDAGRLATLLAGGASLILNTIDEISPAARRVAECFRDAVQARAHLNLYAGWHSQKGFDLHWDAEEIVILQVSGRKRWQIFPPTQDYPLHRAETPKPSGPPAWDGMLEDGDMLYLPRGWWHVAHPVNEPSLHLTVGMTPLHGLNMMNWAMERMRSQAVLREDLPTLKDAAAKHAHMTRLRAAVAEVLNDASIDEFLREARDHVRGRPHFRLPLAPYEQTAPLDSASRVRLASSPVLTFAMQDGKANFKAYGVNYVVPPPVMKALARLNDTTALSLAELSAGLADGADIAALRDGLAMLALAGVVLVEKSDGI